MADAIAWVDPTLALDEGTFNSGDLYTPPGTDKNGVAYPTGGRIYDTMANARAAFAGTGNRMYFRRGMYHVPDGAFTTTARQEFSDYGPTSLPVPIIDCNSYFAPGQAEDSLWTHIGGGIWTQALAGATSYTNCSLWTGASQGTVYKRTQGTLRRRAASANSVGPNAIWYVDTGSPYTITVWTGSTTLAPPTAYGGIIINQISATRCINRAFVFRNGANGGRVSYLKIIGSASTCVGVFSLTSASVSDLQVTNVELNSCNDGFTLSGNAAGTFSATNIRLRNIVVNANITPVGIDLSPSDWLNADWFNFSGLVSDVVVENVLVLTGNCHVVLNTGNLGSGPYYRPSNLTYRNIVVQFLPGSTDGRSIGSMAVTDINYTNVWTYDAPSHGAISGQRIKLQSCGWIDAQLNSVNVSECAQVMAVMSRSEAQNQIANSAIEFYNCVFDTRNSTDQCVGSLAFITYTTTGGALDMPLNSVTVKNCLSLHGVGRGFILKSPLTGASAVINDQIITNNVAAVVSGTAINKIGQVNYAPAAWTDDGLNVTLGAASNTSTLQSALLLVSGYRPGVASPLIGAGSHSGYRTDASGVQFYNPPSIGAYEWPRARTFRT